MSAEEFMKSQYLTLREEIRESKARVFRLVVIATILMPAAGLVGYTHGAYFTTAAIPFLVLVLMAAYVGEQNSIIRAGRYVREHIEPTVEGVTGWERWLESNKRFREADRVFFSVFIVVFFLFYIAATWIAIETLLKQGFGNNELYFWYALGGYALGGLWFLVILLRHWHSCTTTN